MTPIPFLFLLPFLAWSIPTNHQLEISREYRRLGFLVLPLRQPHVERLWTLPWLHRDPADRLLIAQAIAEQIPLVTSDAAVRQYPVQAIW